MASFFFFHGAGPFPLINKQQNKQMLQQLQKIRQLYPNPKAIIIFSAHWQTEQWTILDIDHPQLYYDYYGFPPETYNYSYHAHSTIQLRNQIKETLALKGIKLKQQKKRGHDHGVFVPMMMMDPQAQIPIIQISILKSLNPQSHFIMGKALRELKNSGFLIFGSGASVHGGFNHIEGGPRSQQFNEQLARMCFENDNQEQLLQKIKNWRKLKWSHYLHPRQEHLIPLFINMGAYQNKKRQILELANMGLHFISFIME